MKKVKSERSPEQKKALLEESAKMLAETDAANKAALAAAARRGDKLFSDR